MSLSQPSATLHLILMVLRSPEELLFDSMALPCVDARRLTQCHEYIWAGKEELPVRERRKSNRIHGKRVKRFRALTTGSKS